MEDLLRLYESAGPWLLWVFWVLIYLASIATAVTVLRKRREPMAMLAWILVLLLLPLAGLLLYVLLGEPRIRRRQRQKARRSRKIARILSEHRAAREGDTTVDAAGSLDPGLRELARLSSTLGVHPPRVGNRVTLFEESAETYDDLLASIESAEHHIHLEYYIYRPDETGTLFRDRLAEKARAGVEVRLLVDGIGSWGTSWSFFRPLLQAGGKVAIFLPAVPLRRKWNINYRNHRKVVVIDGRIAYTGSQNIGDEYRGRWRRVAPWTDTHLRIEGPAATDLQEIFLEDWYFASEEELDASAYLNDAPPCGPSLVHIIPSGPDSPQDVLEEYIYLAISLAEKRIRIGTPYFVPGEGLVTALRCASRRQITVELLVPSRTDNRFALWAGRSYYPDLLSTGVRIYEHPSKMLHSKVVVIDDQWALVGSANMDVRSFRTNFEVTASLFDRDLCRQLNRTFDRNCVEATSIYSWPPARYSFFQSVVEGTARLLSPLL